MITKVGKPFKEGELVKKCLLQAASVVCPEKKVWFSNISLSAIQWQSAFLTWQVIHDQLPEKAKHFCANSRWEHRHHWHCAACRYVNAVDGNFEVMEELLIVIPMHGQTAEEIFHHLWDTIVDAGLPWNLLSGITTDGASPKTGRRNGLVAFVQRKLEEGVEEAIALQCVIHQQALCRKCYKFDNVMSVVKSVNHIRSMG